jgi:hypothetical protein
MKLRILGAMLCTVAVASIVLAQSADGTWTGQMQGRGGTQEIALTLKASGGAVTGTMKTGQNEAQIKEGKFEGGTLSFKTEQMFGENTVTVNWSGKVAGDDLTLTRTVEGRGGGGGGGRGGGRGGPQELTLKRQK